MRIAESARQQVSVFRTLFEGPRIMYHGTIASLRVDRMRTVCILRTSIRGASPKDHLERSGSDGHRVLWRRPLFSHARRRGPRTGSTSGWQSHSGAHGNTQETAAENSFAETCKADVSDEASVSLKSHWEEELKKSPGTAPNNYTKVLSQYSVRKLCSKCWLGREVCQCGAGLYRKYKGAYGHHCFLSLMVTSLQTISRLGKV
jgi:hypothetical protein